MAVLGLILMSPPARAWGWSFAVVARGEREPGEFRKRFPKLGSRTASAAVCRTEAQRSRERQTPQLYSLCLSVSAVPVFLPITCHASCLGQGAHAGAERGRFDRLS